MSQVIEARLPKEELEVSATYDFGTDLSSATEIFGADVIFSNFKSAAIVTLQGYMRSLMRQGKDSDAIQEEVANWKPGQRSTRSGKSKAEKLKALMAGLTEDEQMELMEEAMTLPDEAPEDAEIEPEVAA